MKIDTAEVWLANAIMLFQNDRITGQEYDRRLTRVLRGIWLDNGIEAVNNFVSHACLNLGHVTNIHGTPIVKSNLTNEIMQQLPTSR